MGNTPTSSLDVLNQIQQQGQPAAQGAAAAPSTSGSSLDVLNAVQTNPDVATNPAIARPGAYQQTKDGPIQNANDEAKAPFTDSTTSILPDMLNTKPTGALMKRDGESDNQFLARVKEAAKHVTPDMIETEQRSNNARTIPTLAAAYGTGATAGAAPAALEAGGDTLVNFAVKHLAKDVLPELAPEVAKDTLMKLGEKGVKLLLKGALAGAGLKWGSKLIDLL